MTPQKNALWYFQPKQISSEDGYHQVFGYSNKMGNQSTMHMPSTRVQQIQFWMSQEFWFPYSLQKTFSGDTNIKHVPMRDTSYSTLEGCSCCVPRHFQTLPHLSLPLGAPASLTQLAERLPLPRGLVRIIAKQVLLHILTSLWVNPFLPFTAYCLCPPGSSLSWLPRLLLREPVGDSFPCFFETSLDLLIYSLALQMANKLFFDTCFQTEIVRGFCVTLSRGHFYF